ncbi:MAG: hypothetical protein RLY70_638 [Planctomycetota bacterium]
MKHDPTRTTPICSTRPDVRSPIDELEAAAMGDAAERAALAQTWTRWSELLAARGHVITPHAGSEIMAGRAGLPMDARLATDVWAAALERRLQHSERLRQRTRWMQLAASLALTIAMIGGLVGIEWRSQQTMARLDRGREAAEVASMRRPVVSPTHAVEDSAENAGANSGANATANTAANTTTSETFVATLWDDALDTELGKARAQLDSLRSAWRSPSDRLGRLADDLSERLQALESDWSEDAL